MRTLIITAIITILALPAMATGTATAEIDFVGTSPRIVERTDTEGIRFAVVGQFVNYQINEGELLSTEIPQEATGFTVSADGVEFTLAEEPVTRERHPAQDIVDADEPDGTVYTRLPSQEIT